MHIIHLLSNRKWTERAEPVADLALAQQRMGLKVTFVCGRWPLPEGKESSVEEQARLKGLDPVTLDLDKHLGWSTVVKDIPYLKDLVRKDPPDVIHAHMDNAHLVAGLAVSRKARGPRILRSSYEVEGPAPGLRSRFLMNTRTHGLITICEQAAEQAETNYRLPRERITVIEPGIDLDRFDPLRNIGESEMNFDIDPGSFVVGMVSRLREDRLVDIPLQAVHLLAARLPRLRLLIIGHGESEDAMRQAVGQLGIEDRVTWGGYCRGDRLVAAYRAMDVLVYPAPGTDQSCRTVREAMAAGRPVIAPRTGFLAHLIDDGRTGRFMEASPESLAELLSTLHDAPQAASEMSCESLGTARRRFSLPAQADHTVAFYEKILALEQQ